MVKAEKRNAKLRRAQKSQSAFMCQSEFSENEMEVGVSITTLEGKKVEGSKPPAMKR